MIAELPSHLIRMIAQLPFDILASGQHASSATSEGSDYGWCIFCRQGFVGWLDHRQSVERDTNIIAHRSACNIARH